MLVDDAIIVMENIYRRVEDGEELREAVLNGSREVLWPVVAAVATTCAAFAPLLFLEGTSPSCKDAADVNDSGTLDLADPIYLIQFLLRGEPSSTLAG